MQYNEICQCGHNKKCHLDNLEDASTATDCYFQYNCDCKQWRPVEIFKQSYVGEDGYLHSARSLCCNHWLCYYDEKIEAKVHWVGIGEPPENLECRRCTKPVFTPHTK